MTYITDLQSRRKTIVQATTTGTGITNPPPVQTKKIDRGTSFSLKRTPSNNLTLAVSETSSFPSLFLIPLLKKKA